MSVGYDSFVLSWFRRNRFTATPAQIRTSVNLLVLIDDQRTKKGIPVMDRAAVNDVMWAYLAGLRHSSMTSPSEAIKRARRDN